MKRQILQNKTGIATVVLLLALLIGLSYASTIPTTAETVTSSVLQPWERNFVPSREIYVSPNGTGSGTLNDPMSLADAISSPQPGDLYWLQPGNYDAGINLDMIENDGTQQDPIVYRSCSSTQPAKLVGGIRNVGKYTWMWGVDAFDQPTQENVHTGPGLVVMNEGSVLINTIVHDAENNKSGIGGWNTGPNQFYYGNIAYTNGYNPVATQRPHGVYTQNNFDEFGWKYYAENIFLDEYEICPRCYNFHAFGITGFVSGYHLEDNVFLDGRFSLGAGGINNAPVANNVVVGNVFGNNEVIQLGYKRPFQGVFNNNYIDDQTRVDIVAWGRGEQNYPQTGSIEIQNNTFFREFAMTYVTRISGSDFGDPLILGGDIVNNNTYFSNNPEIYQFANETESRAVLVESEWASVSRQFGANTGFAQNAIISAPPTQNFVKVQPNFYENGRGIITIHNLGEVQSDIDISSFFAGGEPVQFEVYHPRDLGGYGAPVASGTWPADSTVTLSAGEFNEISSYVVVPVVNYCEVDNTTPTQEPTTEPTDEPTGEPTDEPTSEPTNEPTEEPTQTSTPLPPTETPLPTATSTPSIGEQCVTFTNNTPTSLPIGQSFIASEIESNLSGQLTDINLSVDMTHPWVGDLGMLLRHELSGESAVLMDRPGFPSSSFGCEGDNILATFDDDSTIGVEGVCNVSGPAISGTIAPENSFTVFGNRKPNSTWTLFIQDFEQADDAGVLNSWSLELCVATEVTATPEPTATNTPEPTATNTPLPTATNTPEPTATNTPTPSPTPQTGQTLLLSAASNSNVGFNFQDEDVIAYDLQTSTWSMLIDASDISPANADTNALTRLGDGSFLLSYNIPTTIPGVGQVDDSDIVRFIPSSLGENTAGTFELYFDGSDVALTTNGEDITALSVTESGTILISTQGTAKVPGLQAQDEDILEFTPSELGENTSGSWSIYFDGTSEGLGDAAESIWGISAAEESMFFTTRDEFSIQGINGEKNDILFCDYSSNGNIQNCALTVEIQGSSIGFPVITIDAIHLSP